MNKKELSAGTTDEQRDAAESIPSASLAQNGMLCAVLSKEEAINLMKQGKKVKHRFFSDDEWVTMVGNEIITEEGYRLSQEEFWAYRNSRFWEKDWSLYGA